MNPSELANMIDLSCVQAQSSLEQLDAMLKSAIEHQCAAVFALPAHTPHLVEGLSEHGNIIVGGVVGFPGGGTTTKSKVHDAQELSAMGCGELDMVINIAWLKAKQVNRVRDDIKAVLEAGGLPLKVIFECHHLNDDDIKLACEICCDVGVAFVKTGTGWAPTGATYHNIELMKSCVGDQCGVKAAGGVRDRETLLKMVELGASRFGIGVKTAESILSGSPSLAEAY
jgi:deoxyribose-phosphate aldolase